MSSESTLWMGDIEPWMNEEIIMKSFNECGTKPTSIKMIKDKRSNTLRNYCFIKFEDMIEANKALIQLNGAKIPNANADCIFKLNWPIKIQKETGMYMSATYLSILMILNYIICLNLNIQVYIMLLLKLNKVCQKGMDSFIFQKKKIMINV